VGLARKAGYWDSFPYQMLAQNYDVILPMGYWTYHTGSVDGAYGETRANIRILRSQPCCATVPIHLIGGCAEDAGVAETAAFVRAAREGRILGASLYGWAGTSAGQWQALGALRR